jgi:Domain of unknown function (DUF4111)
VTSVAEALDRQLHEILGDVHAGLFVYGASMFPHPPGWHFDVDFHALLTRPLTDAERSAIVALHARTRADLDGYYVTIDDARKGEPPLHQLDADVRDHAWPLHRAHVLAGRYEVVSGVDPAPIMVPPTAAELTTALRYELAFVESHPQARAFGVLNACRIVFSVEHDDVVVSKYESAQWARSRFAGETEALDAALRAYTGDAQPGDAASLERAWPFFVQQARHALHK